MLITVQRKSRQALAISFSSAKEQDLELLAQILGDILRFSESFFKVSWGGGSLFKLLLNFILSLKSVFREATF